MEARKSCDQAIHELALGAEIVIGNKEIVLAIFLDIEGAFNKALLHSGR